MFSTILLALVLPALAASQSLVLVGGGLTDGNAPVWNKVVELAVISFLIILKRIIKGSLNNKLF